LRPEGSGFALPLSAYRYANWGAGVGARPALAGTAFGGHAVAAWSSGASRNGWCGSKVGVNQGPCVFGLCRLVPYNGTLPTCGGIQHSHGPSPVHGGQALGVRTEVPAGDPVGAPLEGEQLLAGLQVPHLDGLVPAAGDQPLAAAAQRQAPDWTGVP